MTATAHPRTLTGARSPHEPITARLEQLFGQPWFYYGTLLLLQLKRIWGMWQYRELTTGDTASYFVEAWRWFRYGETNIAWSPLYDCFYGSLLHLSPDAATVTVLHRILIVFAATLLVLAVARRMLPAELAWFVGAWWAILPINFDTMYEVHLFAVLPVLVAWLVIMSGRGAWARGMALAIFFLGTVLVRNEMSIATLCLAGVCLGWEIRRRRVPRRAGTALPSVMGTLIAYAIPALVAAGIVLAVYARTEPKFPELKHVLEGKHTGNMAQVYAFGYSQRHPEYTQNPWTESQYLSIRDFGTAQPSFELMVRRNPRALARHVLWNYRLLPNGLQMLLFSASSGSLDPDYTGINLNERYPMVLSLMALAVVLVGTVLLLKERRWRAWLAERALGWLAMLCVVPMAAAVVAVERPRPSYLFSLAVLLIIYLATCIYVIGRRVRGIERLRPIMPVVMIVLALAVPSAYGGKVHPEQPMLETYERLRPYQRLFADPSAVFAVADYPEEINCYVGLRQARPIDEDIFQSVPAGMSLAELLDSQHASLMYLDYRGWQELEARSPGIVEQFIRDGRKHGWELVAYGLAPRNDRWMLCRRVATESGRRAGGIISPLPGSEQFAGWTTTDSLATMEGPYPGRHLPVVRWGLGPATTLNVRAARPGRYVMLMSGTPALPGQIVSVSVDGRQAAKYAFAPGRVSRFSVPLSLGAGPHTIVLRYANWVVADPTTWEAVLFHQLTLREISDGEPPSQSPGERDTTRP